MAEIRYTGPDPDGVVVTTPDGLARMERLEWVDIDIETARSLSKGNEDFELRSTQKAAKSRKEGDGS